ncbi:hypothetical protein GFY24_40275 [Nocardia sp. SYP-A9097]|uniref:hypothetical protein n=1 Tax=Nocardia sp. SYP-A9097 TaxID=2663237 RepID=UPI00129AD081|nr:hypothetical protein [Nocardia sp. SYP-A9097]MRH93564.1 hypothetical protein [Nocardia sp. SYP-A9097]
MVKFQYLRSGIYVEHGREYQEGVDLATVSQVDLRWYYFLSDLSFTVDGVELAPPWSWTPVLDFLWSIQAVPAYMERGECFRLGFTENDDLIVFTPEAGKVRISCAYCTVEEVAEAVCDISELRDAWVAFRDAVLTELCEEYPQLAANPVLDELQL